MFAPSRPRYTPLALLWLVPLLGCSDDKIKTYPVTGKVVFPDGEAVKTGVVEFRSFEKNLNARGRIGRDGTFELSTFKNGDGAIAGEHQAIVSQVIIVINDGTIHDHGDVVDTKFASYQRSGLKYTVSDTKPNNFKITVERKNKKKTSVR